MYTDHTLSFIRARLLLPALLLLLLALPAGSKAQVYNFAHYDIENGLVQSQVLHIYQDQLHYMWFGSLGGLSRFDGKEFKSYTKSDGLGKSMVTCVLRDRKGRVWVGCEDGVSYIYDNKIVNIRAPDTVASKLVRFLEEDQHNKIWMTMNSRLFYLSGHKIVGSQITSPHEYVTALTKNKAGVLFAAVFAKGIFSFDGTRWVKQVPVKDSVAITRIVFDNNDLKTYYLLSPRQVFTASPRGVSAYPNNTITATEAPLTSLAQDREGNLWVGTNNGAWWLKPGNEVHFTAGNGFSNNPVKDIFRDAEDNIWIATDGAGVYRFDGGSSLSYPTFNGSQQLIMGLAKDSLNNLWIGTSGNGVLKFDGNSFRPVPIPSPIFYSKVILNVLNDHNKDIYAGSLYGLWKFNGSGFSDIVAKMRYPKSINVLFSDYRGTLWIGAPRGCFYYENGKMNWVTGIKQVDAMVELGKDSVLCATSHGFFLVRNRVVDPAFRLPAADNSTVLSLIHYKGIVLAGTFGDGLFIINPATRTLKKYNMKQGFKSNDIYSLAADDQGYIWSGTGRGVNKFEVDPATLSLTQRKNDAIPNIPIECNQNSILNFSGKMWIGATKGLFAFTTRAGDTRNKKPFINIQSVKIMNLAEANIHQQVQSFDNEIPAVFNLGYRQNRILISFVGIYFTDPNDVAYQYRLKGLDENFSQPVKTNMIEFPALLPGTYTFEVKAVSGNGATSAIRSVTFRITPPFYQELWFRVLVFLLLVALIIGIQSYWNYVKARQKRLLRAIQLEEQQRIRRETAEDFHDDIGNKLTRIAVLSDLLNKQIPEGQTEQKNLVSQIKGNAATLYSGTKDILWALDPQSDNLDEIIAHLKNLGAEIFESSETHFSFKHQGNGSNNKLPMKYSRNISMILKETFHNILKHANARQVDVAVLTGKGALKVTINDDGDGFNTLQAGKGRGLNNMKIRAKRVNGELTIASVPGKGSCITLAVPLTIDYEEIITG